MSARVPARHFAAIAVALSLLSGCSGALSSPAPTSAQPPPSPPQASPVASSTAAPTARPIVVRDGEPWIAYQGGTGGPARIRLVRPDGTDDHALIDDLVADYPDGEQQHPDWSHDGTRIAFGAAEADGTQDLWIVKANGSGAQKLYDCAAPCGWADHPAWSPDDRAIAFESADHVGAVDSTSSLEIIDVATRKRRALLRAPDLAWFYGPRWSPDGTRIVVEADRFATARFDEERVTASTVGIVDLTAASPEFDALMPWTSFAVYPDWDPTGNWIALQLPTRIDAPFHAADIAILDLDGTRDPVFVTSFGPTGGWGIQPTWTPDGSTITFVAEDVVRSHPNAALVKRDGTGLTRLSDEYFRTHPRLRPTP
jgi:Tol biopolymer transport system component